MSLSKVDPRQVERGWQVVLLPPHALITQIVSHASDMHYGIVTGPANKAGLIPVRFFAIDPTTKRWNGKMHSADRLLAPENLYVWNSIPQNKVETILQEIGA
jgi:hypothetical protein